MKIDLGCGTNKHSGFLGIDRLPLPDVDIICDMNRPLPLPDDSVEYVMASRSLPYVEDILAVMADIYRICIHKAIVCILAPYAHNFSHASNPYLKQKFDEYTPRYFTGHFYQPSQGAVCPELNAYVPDTPPSFDFRLLRMELFYQSPYVPPLYEEDELEALKGVQTNVVHEIMYHFLVIKHPISHAELERLSGIPHLEPKHVRAIRGGV